MSGAHKVSGIKQSQRSKQKCDVRGPTWTANKEHTHSIDFRLLRSQERKWLTMSLGKEGC